MLGSTSGETTTQNACLVPLVRGLHEGLIKDVEGKRPWEREGNLT